MSIYYWKAAKGNIELLDTFHDKIRSILSGDYNHHDLEKLRVASSHIIYSYRLNDVERLLFTTHKGCLHVLEHLPTHDYQKSRFLKKGVLREALKKESTETLSTLFSPLEANETPPTFASPISDKIIGLDYYHKHYITPSDEQLNIVQTPNYPTAIPAPAGAGKSYVALSALSNALDTGGVYGRYLFVSQSPRLVNEMQENWLDGFVIDNTHSVEFKTYDDLLIAGGSSRAASDVFQQWYGCLKDDPRIPLDSAEAYYNECRICSGFTQAHYLTLGVRQSAIIDTTARSLMYGLYQKYLAYLDHSGLIDEAFAPLNQTSGTYDLVVVDEAQNLSLHQHQQLARLAKNNTIIFCMDSHQNLYDASPILSLLEQSFRHNNIILTIRPLNTTHRYTTHVASALTHIMSMGRKILGGTLDKHEALSMEVDATSAEKGQFLRLQPSELGRLPGMNDLANSTQFAVITTAEFIEEARSLFKTPLVLTPEQVIGQEFQVVLVYKLWTDDRSKAILSAIKPDVINATQSADARSKDKYQKKNHAYASWLNTYFIGCSRAINTLIIVEKNTHGNRFFWESFATTAASPIATSTTLDSDWDAMAQQQQKHGNDVIAERIKQERINVQSALVDEKTVSMNSKPVVSRQLSSKNKSHQQQFSQLISVSPILFDDALGVKLCEAAWRNDFKQIKLLLSNERVNANHSDKNDLKALWLAACKGHLDIVRTLLKCKDIEINCLDEVGNTALYIAAQNGHLEVVIALLKCTSIDINHVNQQDATALMVAASQGHLNITLELLKHDNIDANYGMKKSFSALAAAAKKGRHEIVLALLKYKKIDLRINDNGSKALFEAATLGHLNIVLELLKFNDININHTDEAGFTALMMAAQNGHLEVVNALLECNDIDINHVCNNYEYTALMMAAQNGYLNIALALLKCSGININHASDKTGFTALIIAAENGRVAIVLALLECHDIDINHANKKGVTALIKAAQCGHLKIVNALLNCNGIDVNSVVEHGITALIMAVGSKQQEIVVALLKETHININQVAFRHEPQKSFTALSLAAIEFEHIGIINILLEHDSIHINYSNNLDFGILAYIAARGYTDVVRKLLQKGAINSSIHLKMIWEAANTEQTTSFKIEILKVLLDDHRILKHTILHILESPEMYATEIAVRVQLISRRREVWGIIKSHIEANLDSMPEAHSKLLESILNSTEKHIMHMILFTKPRLTFSLFDNETELSSMIETELNDLIAKSQARCNLLPPLH